MNLHTLLVNSIDEAREDLWSTGPAPYPEDRFERKRQREADQAEAWGAVLDYREERLDFDNLLMFLQSFDANLTPTQLIKLLGRHYHG